MLLCLEERHIFRSGCLFPTCAVLHLARLWACLLHKSWAADGAHPTFHTQREHQNHTFTHRWACRDRTWTKAMGASVTEIRQLGAKSIRSTPRDEAHCDRPVVHTHTLEKFIHCCSYNHIYIYSSRRHFYPQ